MLFQFALGEQSVSNEDLSVLYNDSKWSATKIYRKTGNLRAVQLLLGHTKMDSTVRYLGVELEDALAIAEAVEI